MKYVILYQYQQIKIRLVCFYMNSVFCTKARLEFIQLLGFVMCFKGILRLTKACDKLLCFCLISGILTL